MCREAADQIAICLQKGEFQSAHRRLEIAINQIRYARDGDVGDVPLSHLIGYLDGDSHGNWYWDLLEKLEEYGIEYVSQIQNRGWEDLRDLGLGSDQIAWIKRSIETLQRSRDNGP